MTQLQVCNAALDQIGQDPITAITDNTPKALTLNRQWDFAFDRLLRDAHWNWALTYAEFNLASGTPLVRWDYRYTVPDDYISMVALNGTYTETPSDRWEIVRLDETRYLLTDEDEALVEYIYKPTASNLDAFVGDMDPLAVDALVTLLASRIATHLAKDGRTLAKDLLQQYLKVDLPQAIVRNVNESRRGIQRPESTSTARWARSTFDNS